jgi:hypothetical protein
VDQTDRADREGQVVLQAGIAVATVTAKGMANLKKSTPSQEKAVRGLGIRLMVHNSTCQPRAAEIPFEGCRMSLNRRTVEATQVTATLLRKKKFNKASLLVRTRN